jgi:polyisoprenoid-binding protein YceI
MNRPTVAVIGTVLLLLLSLGCSNPATGKPEAEVGEASTNPAPATAETGDRYVISDGSTVGFTGSKVTGSHEGGFNAFEGAITLVGGDPVASGVEVTIDTTSLWSDHEKLTGHLKSADFFDVENFPTASFQSTSIEAAADGGYTVTGNLDLHGVTKSVSFPAAITVEEGRVSAQAEFFIKRFDFGIEYPGKADDLIRDEVVIRLDLVAEPAAV